MFTLMQRRAKRHSCLSLARFLQHYRTAFSFPQYQHPCTKSLNLSFTNLYAARSCMRKICRLIHPLHPLLTGRCETRPTIDRLAPRKCFKFPTRFGNMSQPTVITREHSGMYHVLFERRYGNAVMMVVMQLAVESWGNYLSVMSTAYDRVCSCLNLEPIELILSRGIQPFFSYLSADTIGGCLPSERIPNTPSQSYVGTKNLQWMHLHDSTNAWARYQKTQTTPIAQTTSQSAHLVLLSGTTFVGKPRAESSSKVRIRDLA